MGVAYYNYLRRRRCGLINSNVRLDVPYVRHLGFLCKYQGKNLEHQCIPKFINYPDFLYYIHLDYSIGIGNSGQYLARFYGWLNYKNNQGLHTKFNTYSLMYKNYLKSIR